MRRRTQQQKNFKKKIDNEKRFDRDYIKQKISEEFLQSAPDNIVTTINKKRTIIDKHKFDLVVIREFDKYFKKVANEEQKILRKRVILEMEIRDNQRKPSTFLKKSDKELDSIIRKKRRKT